MGDYWLWIKRTGRIIGGLLAFVIAVSALVLLIRLLWAPTDIGTPATESEALTRANERMLDMAKWTISTILLIGGGLIGLNWYTNEQRYREDRASLEERFNRVEKMGRAQFTVLAEERVAVQKQILEVKFDLYQLTGQIANSMMLMDGKMPLGGYVNGVIDMLRKPFTSDLIKSRALEDIAVMFERENSASSFTVFLGLDSIPELAVEAEKQGFGEFASRLRK